MALPISLLLVGAGYVFVVMGPLLSARLSPLLATSTAAGPDALTRPAASSAGLALLGAVAFALVLMQLVRDVERHPYAAIAPVLAVFSALLLGSTRTTLPLPGWTGEYLGLVVLALALLGGALLARPSSGVRLFGWLLAVLPFASVCILLWSQAPHGALALTASLQTYLTLLGLSALALALSGLATRTLTASEPEPADEPQPLPTPRAVIEVSAPRAPSRPRDPIPPHVLTKPKLPHAVTQPVSSVPSQPMLDMAFDEQAALALMRPKATGWRSLAICGVIGAAFSVGAYFYAKPSLSLLAVPLAPRAEQAPSPAADPLEVVRPAEPSIEPLTAVGASAQVEAREPQANPLDVREQRREPVAHGARSDLRRAAREERRRQELARARSEPSSPSKSLAGATDSAKQATSAAHESNAADAKSPSTPAQAETASARAPQAKPSPAPREVSARDEGELDLDQLVHKALKGGGSSSVNAADDPLLGL